MAESLPTPETMLTQTATAQGSEELLMSQIIADRDAAISYQAPRQPQWNESIALSRDKVSSNRLLQRHPVNMPMMKENEGVWLGKINDFPINYIECESDDVEAQQHLEMLVNQLWEKWTEDQQLQILDYIGKKAVYYAGRTFTKFGLKNRMPVIHQMDPFDVVVDPKMLPWDIETAGHVHHLNIFRRLAEVMSNPKFDSNGKQKLKSFMATSVGVASSEMATDQLASKIKRMQDMGVKDFLALIGTDQIVKMTESIKELWDAKTNKFERYVITYAFETILLRKEKLFDAIGIVEYPYDTWSYSPSTDTVWDVSPADSQRVINKIENLWLSQTLEGRTLRTYQMQYFDSTKPNFNPTMMEPRPFGWYPVPGKPSDVVQPIQTGNSSENLGDMEYLRNMASRVINISDINRGLTAPGNRTKGEIQILADQSQQPTNNVAKFYNAYWRRVCKKWISLLKANHIAGDKVRLTKRGRNGAIYAHELKISDIAKADYNPRVVSKEDKSRETNQNLTKLKFLGDRFASSPEMTAIINKRIVKELDVFDQSEMADVKRILDAPTVVPSLSPAGGPMQPVVAPTA